MPTALVTVTSPPYRRADGAPAAGTVTMTPTEPFRLPDATIVRAPVTGQLDLAGRLELHVYPNTVPGTEPPGTGYIVLERLVGQPALAYPVVVPHDRGSTVDLAGLRGATVGGPPVVAPLRRIQDATDYDGSHALVEGAVLAVTADGRFAPSAPGEVGGDAAALVLTRTAAGAGLSGHRVVYPATATEVDYADPGVPEQRGAPMWLSLQAAAAGQPVRVLLRGVVTEPSWTWTAHAPVYLGVAGQLTQTPPTTPGAALVVLGSALAADTLVYDPEPSVTLA